MLKKKGKIINIIYLYILKIIKMLKKLHHLILKIYWKIMMI